MVSTCGVLAATIFGLYMSGFSNAEFHSIMYPLAVSLKDIFKTFHAPGVQHYVGFQSKPDDEVNCNREQHDLGSVALEKVKVSSSLSQMLFTSTPNLIIIAESQLLGAKAAISPSGTEEPSNPEPKPQVASILGNLDYGPAFQSETGDNSSNKNSLLEKVADSASLSE